MSAWEKNLEVLKQVNPALAKEIAGAHAPADHRLSPSRQGAPYLQVGGRRLHSPYDPVKEGEVWRQAQDLAGTEPVVVFGLGLGYHIFPLLTENRSVYVVEPSPAVAKLALEQHDFTALLGRNGLRLGQDFRDLPRPARLLHHGPSRRLASGLYRRLAAFLAGESDSGGSLKVLVVSPLYGGSHPVARYTALGFRQLGHDAELLDFAPFYPAHQALAAVAKDHRLSKEWLKFLGEILLSKVREWHPDLVFCLAQAPVNPPLVQTIKDEGALVAYWFVEDYQVFSYWRDLAPAVDVFFTLQQEPFFQELRRLGVRHPAFLPLAADPDIYRPISLTPEEGPRYGAALAFVGAGYRNRREFFQGFLDLDFKIWGCDWNLAAPLGPAIQNQGARVSEDEAVKIFNASRINLNLHSSPFHPGINPHGDYLNPRVFDLAAAGAFQLVDHRSQLPAFFRPEEEVATFSSFAEARDKVEYFLPREEQRRHIAQQGRERCLRDHTYAGRLGEALAIIEDFYPEVLPQRPRPENPLHLLLAQFPDDHPLQTALAKVPQGVTDLGGVVEHLQKGDGPLTEPEALLWLLHEFQQGLQRGRF